MNRGSGRLRRVAKIALAAALSVALLFSLLYIARWYRERRRMQEEAARYATLMSQTPAPSPTAAPTPSEPKLFAADPADTERPSPTLPPPTPAPTFAPTKTPTPVVYSVPTPGQVQDRFVKLLEYNPDAVAYLTIPGLLSLPVAQRVDDNEYYMTHGFDDSESREGCLFLDGSNRIGVDQNLIVYGHNMKNGAMFGCLKEYGGLNGVRKYCVINFDTLYGDGQYVLIGAFHASMEAGEDDYFDLRRFLVDEDSFNRYVSDVLTRSKFYIPVGAMYGDKLLVLVTCGSGESGRMVCVFRAVRDGEDAESLKSAIRADSFRYQDK